MALPRSVQTPAHTFVAALLTTVAGDTSVCVREWTCGWTEWSLCSRCARLGEEEALATAQPGATSSCSVSTGTVGTECEPIGISARAGAASGQGWWARGWVSRPCWSRRHRVQ